MTAPYVVPRTIQNTAKARAKDPTIRPVNPVILVAVTEFTRERQWNARLTRGGLRFSVRAQANEIRAVAEDIVKMPQR